MDVFKALLAIVLLAVVTSACSKSDPAQVFSLSEKTNCQGLRVKNEFLVRWKSGALTLEHFDGDHHQFINDFISPQLEKIEHAEYNHKVFEVFPSDSGQPQEVPYFASDFNWGASYSHADFAWQNNVRGQGIIVAVIDDGVNIHHPNLANQIYYNPGENGLDANGKDKATNNIDDDGNGYVDDFAGYNFAKNSPYNEDTGKLPYRGHGSHVSGTIAAEHHDSEITFKYPQGIAPETKILPLDFIDDDAGGTILQAIAAIEYAANMGAKIINASWGGPGCSIELSNTIAKLEDKNVLFVAAAGNASNDIDKVYLQEFPAAFIHPTQITVGSIAQSGYMAGHSNYGAKHVSIFAPGMNIISTVPPYKPDPNKNETIYWDDMSGTSMATPHVSGAAALLWSYKPSATAREIKEVLLKNSAYHPSYINSSQGRLDIKSALEALMEIPPTP